MKHQPNNTAIKIQRLEFTYPRQTQPVIAIDHLSIDKAEHIVITGHSGSGKSTLLHLIAGLMNPTTGTISITETDIHQLPSSKRDRFRGRHIGMVFQTFHLLQGFTVLENILAAMMFSDIPRKEHDDKARALLKVLGINAPDARIDDLSIGQQQRVAVARAVACSPSVVLADEPTAALDSGYASIAMDLLQEACRSIGAALVCVTHDTSLIDRFDRHVRLEELSSIGSAL